MNEFVAPCLTAQFAPVFDLLSKTGGEAELIRRIFFYQIYTPEFHTPVWAAAHGRLSVLQYIWHHDFPLFTLRVRHWCLDGATKHGQVSILQWFFELGNHFPSALWTVAAKEKQLDVLRYLATLDMELAFREACRFAHMNIVHELLLKGVNPRAGDDEALCWAAYGNKLEVVKLLVEKYGADVRAQNNDCIRFACGHGHLELVRYLVSYGADYRVNDDESFDRALKGQHEQVVGYLLDQIPELAEMYSDQLLDMFNCGKREMMRVILPALDCQEVTILACKVGRLKLLRFIASASCLEVSDEAILAVAERGHLDMMKFLVEHGGNLRANNDAPMSIVAAAGRLNFVRYLFAQGASLEAAWPHAAQSQNKYLINYVMEKGLLSVASVLRYASFHGLEKVVRDFLLPCNSYSLIGVLFEVACCEGHVNVIKLLLGRTFGSTVRAGFMSAARRNHLHVVKYLVSKYGKQYFADAERECSVQEDYVSGQMLRYLNTIRKSCK